MASTDGVISTPQELWTEWALPQAILGSELRRHCMLVDVVCGMHLKMRCTAHTHVGDFSRSTACTP
jgi:hypothetical protein